MYKLPQLWLADASAVHEAKHLAVTEIQSSQSTKRNTCIQARAILVYEMHSIKHSFTTHFRTRLKAEERLGYVCKGSIHRYPGHDDDGSPSAAGSGIIHILSGAVVLPLRQVHAALPLLQLPVKIRWKPLIIAFFAKQPHLPSQLMPIPKSGFIFAS